LLSRWGTHIRIHIYIYYIYIKRKREEEEQIRSGIIRRGRHPESIIDIMRQKREREKGTGMLDKGRCALSNT
jgi:hypothetical protein